MTKPKAPDGWDFEETSDGIMGTRRDPNNPTAERTVFGTDHETAYAEAERVDQMHAQRDQAEADAKNERAARLKAEAEALEDGREYVAPTGVDGVTVLPEADKEELRKHRQRDQQLATLVGS